MSDQWFVHSNGEQMGPYTGAQLVEYAQQGNIVPETMVWAEGMPEWAPASQIPGLFPEAPAPVAVAAAAPTTSAAWAPPGSRLATGGAAMAGAKSLSSLGTQVAPVGGEYPKLAIKGASFTLWLWMFVGGFLCFFIALLMMISGAMQVATAVTSDPAFSEMIENAEAAQSGDAVVDSEVTEAPDMVETPDPAQTAAVESATVGAAATFGFAGILFFIGWAVLLASAIIFMMYLYRAWACLQPGGAQTTPGKAVGFMFIPFFNIYWVFVAINGLPKDWNRVVASYEDLKAAPKLSETTFLLYCIGVFFAPLALIMIFPMVSQLCKGINFFAARQKALTTAGYRPFGVR